jgi:hypothetical protein
MIVSKFVEPTSQRIDLVDKDNAAVLAFSSALKELSDPLCPDSYKNLLELRCNYFDEATASLVCQCSC